MVGGYADYLYQLGMLDEPEAKYFKSQTDLVQKYVAEKKYLEAYAVSTYLSSRIVLERNVKHPKAKLKTVLKV